MTYRAQRRGRRGDGADHPRARPPRRGAAGRHQPGRGRRRAGRTLSASDSGGSTSGSTTPAPTSSPAPAAGCPGARSSTCVLAVDLRGTILASWAAVETDARARGGVIINMSWDHVSSRHGGREPDPLFGGQGRHRELQQVARAGGGAGDPGEHPGAGLHRDRLRRAGRPGLAPGRRGAHAARALGHAGGRGRRGGVPGLGRLAGS